MGSSHHKQSNSSRPQRHSMPATDHPSSHPIISHSHSHFQPHSNPYPNPPHDHHQQHQHHQYHQQQQSSFSSSTAVPLSSSSSSLSIFASSASRRPVFPLLSIFFAEFDNIVGPKISCQSPPNFLSTSQFDDIADFFITSPDLSRKLISVTAFGYRILGLPCALSHGKYHRNALLFSIGFVFSSSCAELSRPYESVLRKLAHIIETLEIESEFLFRMDEKRRTLNVLLSRIYRQLNTIGECSVYADEANKINLKLYPLLPQPPSIRLYETPIRVRDLDALMKTEWDLTLREVIPYIDNVNYVNKISVLSGINVELVRQCVRQLVYFGCVIMVDVFQFGNIYATGDRIGNYLKNVKMQKDSIKLLVPPELIHHHHHQHQHQQPQPQTPSAQAIQSATTTPQFHSRSSTSQPQLNPALSTHHRPILHPHEITITTKSLVHPSSIPTHSPSPRLSSVVPKPVVPLTPAAIFRLYSDFGRGTRVQDWVKKHELLTYGIDVRQWILFGVTNQLIRRVHHYPVLLQNSESKRPSGESIERRAVEKRNRRRRPFRGKENRERTGTIEEEKEGQEENEDGHESTEVERGGIGGGAANGGSKAENSENGVGEDEDDFDDDGDEEEEGDDVYVSGAVAALCDGRHCFDEICCELSMPAAQLESMLKRDPRCVIITR